MLLNLNLFEGITNLLSHNNIISISGKSGTGKTSLALYLIGNLLTQEKNFTDSCIWVQASELFPVKRITQMFENHHEKLNYIMENMFVIPQEKPFHTYSEQSLALQKITSPSTILPPFLKYVVIDNISHHLRFEIGQSNKVHYISLLDNFYETQLLPLILFCKRNDIVLILIHEVTYSPSLQRIRPFFYKLYDRIGTIDIILSNVYNSEKKNMLISLNQAQWNFQFILEQRGIIIL